MVGFVSSPKFVEHLTGEHHPERPDRIRAIHRAVREAGMLDSPDPFPEFVLDTGLGRIRPKDGGGSDASFILHPSSFLRAFSPEPADLKWVREVHSQDLVELVQHMSRHGGVLDQGDTPVCPASFEIGLLSLGSTLCAADAVMKGEVKRAFSAARPPGHHAEPDRAMGFCLFSNIAIAARYAQKTYGVGKIAIVDFDVHHGNGTQAVFEEDPSVLFISLHQHPRTCYPGTGYEWEIGVGAGKGFTMNIPMMPGSDDADYMPVIDGRVIPRINEFRPELLMISAGFDAHRDDPLANISLTEAGYEKMTRKLVEVADVHCGGKVLSVLEGGYNLRALGRSVVGHLMAMQ